MKYSINILPSVLYFINCAFAQIHDSVSIDPLSEKAIFSNPAKILPYFSMGIGAYIIPYTTAVPEYRGHLFINIKNTGEITLHNEEFVIDFNGHCIRTPIMYEIKLNLLSERAILPSISISYRNMFFHDNEQYELIHHSISRPDLRNGFWLAGFTYQINTAQVMTSKQITDQLLCSVSLGIKNIEISNFYIYGSEPSDYRRSESQWSIIPCGQFNAQYNLNNRITLLGEIQSFAALIPDTNNIKIQVGQSMMVALGTRISITEGIGFNIFARDIVPFVGPNNSDIIFGLTMALPEIKDARWFSNY